jgi:hypothetical protein
MNSIDLYKKPEPAQQRVIPVVPGSPWAPPQDTAMALRPELLVPAPDEPPADPTDPLAPLDPTVRTPVMSSDPLLKLPPEGMLRLLKDGEEDRFCFPVHVDGWRELGWQVELPISTEGGGDGGGGGGTDGGGNTTAVPTVTSIKPAAPLTAGGPAVLVSLVGTGFEATGDVVVWGDSQAAAGDYTFASETEVSFGMDCSLVGEAYEVPFVVSNSGGESETYVLSVGPAAGAAAAAPAATAAAEVQGLVLELPAKPVVEPEPAPAPEPALEPEPAPEPVLELIDYASMTKAEITQSVQLNHGVSLDSSLTKAEMVAEAERLDLEKATAPDVALPEVPMDLLG